MQYADMRKRKIGDGKKRQRDRKGKQSRKGKEGKEGKKGALVNFRVYAFVVYVAYAVLPFA